MNKVHTLFSTFCPLSCALLFALLLPVQCHKAVQSPEEVIGAEALRYAEAFVHLDVAAALPLCDSLQQNRLLFLVNNLSESDIDSLHSVAVAPEVVLLHVDITQPDSLATATLLLRNVFLLDSLGKPGCLHESGHMRLHLAKQAEQWLITHQNFAFK